MAEFRLRLYYWPMTQPKRPLSMIAPEQCVALMLGGRDQQTKRLGEALSRHDIVTISEIDYMQTFHVSGTLMSVFGDTSKRQLIIHAKDDYPELAPSVLWGLENGLDVFVALTEVRTNSPAQSLALNRLSSAGATIMALDQCLFELNWPCHKPDGGATA